MLSLWPLQKKDHEESHINYTASLPSMIYITSKCRDTSTQHAHPYLITAYQPTSPPQDAHAACAYALRLITDPYLASHAQMRFAFPSTLVSIEHRTARRAGHSQGIHHAAR